MLSHRTVSAAPGRLILWKFVPEDTKEEGAKLGENKNSPPKTTFIQAGSLFRKIVDEV